MKTVHPIMELMHKDFLLGNMGNSFFLAAVVLLLTYIREFPTFCLFIMSSCVSTLYMIALSSRNGNTLSHALTLPVTRKQFLKSIIVTSAALSFLTVCLQAIILFFLPYKPLFLHRFFHEHATSFTFALNATFFSFEFVSFTITSIVFYPRYFSHPTDSEALTRLYFISCFSATLLPGIFLSIINVGSSPLCKLLKATDFPLQLKQLPFLFAAIALWSITWFVLYRVGVKKFEKVNL